MKQSWFFDKINKIDKPLAKLTKTEKSETKTKILQWMLRKSREIQGHTSVTYIPLNQKSKKKLISRYT